MGEIIESKRLNIEKAGKKFKETMNKAEDTNTTINYNSQWKTCRNWLLAYGLNDTLPTQPQDLAKYLVAISSKKISTIKLAVAAINFKHKEAGHPAPGEHPAIKKYLKGLNKEKIEKGEHVGQVKPLTLFDIARIEATACLRRSEKRVAGENVPRKRGTERLHTARIRGQIEIAIIKTLHSGMLRVSELTDLRKKDLTMDPEDGSGILKIRRSKTDQDGSKADQVYLPPETVQAIKKVYPPYSTPEERIFPYTPQHVRQKIKSACQAAGIDDWERCSSHSGRVGMAIDLSKEKQPLHAVQQAGRWKSANMPARYIRGTELKRGAVAQLFGGKI